MSRTMSRSPATVNHQRASRYHRAFIWGEVESLSSDFLRFCHSPVQLCRRHLAIGGFRVGVIFQPREHERRFHSARANAIEPDTGMRMIQRQRLGHSTTANLVVV